MYYRGAHVFSAVAVEVAKHCCERFARDVLRHVKAEEDTLKEAVVSG